MRTTRLVLVLASLLSVAMLAVLNLPAAVAAPRVASENPAPGEPQTSQELLDLFGAPNIAADYVVVVDTSGSMREGKPPPYVETRKAVARFAESVQEGDRVSLFFFDGTFRPSFAKTISSNRDRQLLKQTVEDEQFRGQSTDIGSALAGAQDAIEAANDQGVSTLIFVSDGANDPPGSSPYSKNATGAKWDQLARRGKALAETRVLNVAGIGVGTVAGVNLLRRAFPTESVKILSLPADQLAGAFADLVKTTQLSKIRQSVVDDLNRDVSAELDLPKLQPGETGSLTLTNQREKLATTVAVDAASLRTADGAPIPAQLAPKASQPVTLAPGESVSYTLTPAPDDAVDTSTAWASDGVSEDVTLDLSLRLTTPTKDLLQRVYVGDPLPGDSLGRTVETTATTTAAIRPGIPLWLMGLCLLILAVVIAIAVWLVRLWKVPPQLQGYLTVEGALDGTARSVALQGRSMTVPNVELPLPDAEDSVASFFTKPGPSNRSKVFVRCRKGSVKVHTVLDPVVGTVPTEEGEPIDVFDQVAIGDAMLRYTLVATEGAAA